MIPEGWKFEPQGDVFNTIRITTPQGWVTLVSSTDRNPAIILHQLTLELCASPPTSGHVVHTVTVGESDPIELSETSGARLTDEEIDSAVLGIKNMSPGAAHNYLRALLGETK